MIDADPQGSLTASLGYVEPDELGVTLAIFKNVIPMSVKAAETSAEGISIYTHCPKSKVSMAYMNLTQEVMSDEK